LESKKHLIVSIVVAVVWFLICPPLTSSVLWWFIVGIISGVLVDLDHVIVASFVSPRELIRALRQRDFDGVYYTITHIELGYAYWHTFTILWLMFATLVQRSPIHYLVILELIVHWLFDLPGMLAK